MPATNQPNTNQNNSLNQTKGYPGMNGGLESGTSDKEIAARLSNAEGSMDDVEEDKEMSEEGEDAFVDADVEADEDVTDDEDLEDDEE